VPPPPAAPDARAVLDPIAVHFATGATAPDPSWTPTLAPVLELLRADPDLALEVAGHTDDVGSASTNQRVSEARAAAVREWLIEQGGPTLADRLTARGYGESLPAEPNLDESSRARNRRVVLTAGGAPTALVVGSPR